MISIFRSKHVVLLLAALVSVTALAGDEAQAQRRPFKIRGQGTIIDPIPLEAGGVARHNIRGNATYLRRHTGKGVAKILSLDFPNLKGTFESDVPFVFVASNGDRLAFHYGNVAYGAQKAGEVTLIPADGQRFRTVWVAEFTPYPKASTGRFKQVVGGSVIVVARTPAFAPGDGNIKYTWKGEGYLEFERGGARR